MSETKMTQEARAAQEAQATKAPRPDQVAQEASVEKAPATQADTKAGDAETDVTDATDADAGGADDANADDANAGAPKPYKTYHQIIEAIDRPQLRKLNDFAVGDTVSVKVRVKEGERERTQAFNGVVIAKRSRGINSSFLVRKKTKDESVERMFQYHSPLIESVTVKARGRVRRAKLYYLRQLRGLAARIPTKFN